MTNDPLPFTVDVWDSRGEFVRYLARGSTYAIARAAYDAAIKEDQTNEITMRLGASIFATRKARKWNDLPAAD